VKIWSVVWKCDLYWIFVWNMLNVWKYVHLCENLIFTGYLCQCLKIWSFMWKFYLHWIFLWNMLNLWKYGYFWSVCSFLKYCVQFLVKQKGEAPTECTSLILVKGDVPTEHASCILVKGDARCGGVSPLYLICKKNTYRLLSTGFSLHQHAAWPLAHIRTRMCAIGHSAG
jgi:hypothetical protein